MANPAAAGTEPWPVTRITADLRRLGVRPGDLVMVHASLRAVGPVAGGADGVLDALAAALAPDGTLVMNLGARDDGDWVNERPEAERATLLQEAADVAPFDSLATPADPDVGVLAEVLRTRPGTVVGDHPDGRFGASGPAASLVRDVPWDDYYGPGSPLERFCQRGGRVLRLGADPDTVTAIHLAEYRVPLPGKRRVRRHHLVTGPQGPVVRVVEGLDDSDGIVDHPGDDYFTEILHAYLATGRAATGLVGRATSELLDAADVVDFAVTWMSRHLTP
jgi:aminoglycoside 3-N-acetyltransferase